MNKYIFCFHLGYLLFSGDSLKEATTHYFTATTDELWEAYLPDLLDVKSYMLKNGYTHLQHIADMPGFAKEYKIFKIITEAK